MQFASVEGSVQCWPAMDHLQLMLGFIRIGGVKESGEKFAHWETGHLKSKQMQALHPSPLKMSLNVTEIPLSVDRSVYQGWEKKSRIFEH